MFFDVTDNIKLFGMMNRIRVDYCGVDEGEVSQINDTYKLKLVREFQDKEIDDLYLLDDEAFNPAEEDEVSISEDSGDF